MKKHDRDVSEEMAKEQLISGKWKWVGTENFKLYLYLDIDHLSF